MDGRALGNSLRLGLCLDINEAKAKWTVLNQGHPIGVGMLCLSPSQVENLHAYNNCRWEQIKVIRLTLTIKKTFTATHVYLTSFKTEQREQTLSLAF